MKRILLAATAAALLSASALAKSGMHHGAGHGQPTQNPHAGHGNATAQPAGSPSAAAFAAANKKMHEDMDIVLTGDADTDFMRGMIPHHQGAIDMARIVLVHGKDPQVRKLAEEIVKAQESEIAMMRDWLRKNGKSQ